MFKSIPRKLAFPLILFMLTVSVARGFAATGDGISPPSPAQRPDSTGVTGTDPEPSKPQIVDLILDVLYLL
jgi:hypothetical protein